MLCSDWKVSLSHLELNGEILKQAQLTLDLNAFQWIHVRQFYNFLHQQIVVRWEVSQSVTK